MKDVENSSKAGQGSKTKETEHLISRCQNFAHLISRCENFDTQFKVRNPRSKGAIFAHPNSKVRNGQTKSSISISAMAKTRGGLSASPSSPRPRTHRATMGGAASPPVQAPAIPPSERGGPSQRRYPTRRPPTDPVPPTDQVTSSVSRPPAKRTRFSGPGESSHAPRPRPRRTSDSRDMPPEVVISAHDSGPPIEGNLDCEIDLSIRDLL
ncbi:hypothetical protein AAG906_001602 [Vitis piasezkii]